MKLYKLYPSDSPESYYVGTDIRGMIAEVGEISGCEVGEKYTVEIVEMSEDEVNALPEFDGF